MRAYASGAFSRGSFSIIGRTPAASAKRRVSSESDGVRLAQGALETRDALRMDDMAARFDEAVTVTVDRRGANRQFDIPQPQPDRS